MYWKAIGVLVLFSAFIAFAGGEDCNTRSFPDGIVCVCNATYCDTVPPLTVSSGYYQVYSTRSSKLGFDSKTGLFTHEVNAAASTIKVDQAGKYQTIIGFGGAFTDSTGINIKLLPEKAQDKLMDSYFSQTGIEYNLCRVPIGGTDFSTRGYSYDDFVNDTTLEHFALQPEDMSFKIPFIQKAKSLTDNKLKLFASAWSAPTWMKTNNDWSGVGTLQDEYYQLWADYTIKFFDAYKVNNITFWGMTTQNEPIDGFVPSSLMKINLMGFSTDQMNTWVGDYLGPTLKNSTYKDLKVILHDDSRLTLSSLKSILNNTVTMRYADGVGVHWYWNFLFPASDLLSIKSEIKDVFILATEACNGYLAFTGLEKAVAKGSWSRAVNYITDILGNLENGASGWVDWNMVLDESGGPTYINNFVDAPVLVNEALQEFYKQPMFYALGHFSKFILPGSVRLKTSVGTSVAGTGLKAMAFLRPDNLTAIVIFNSAPSGITVEIENAHSQTATIRIDSESINTVLYDHNYSNSGIFSAGKLNWVCYVISLSIIITFHV